ncbi:hypothetical protein [Burkholderia ubonensis]|uniref:hypothetical protein n=1 Tax=Burkholderia ubonensis TaxID=101571 RepID=UPI0012FA6EE0|nr:hypothetical protein [Burkholderia ubonensis]
MIPFFESTHPSANRAHRIPFLFASLFVEKIVHNPAGAGIAADLSVGVNFRNTIRQWNARFAFPDRQDRLGSVVVWFCEGGHVLKSRPFIIFVFRARTDYHGEYDQQQNAHHFF